MYDLNYAKFYENLTSDTTLDDYKVFFDSNSTFEDPFQRVQGIDKIHNIFLDMYEKLHKPMFIIDEVITSNDVTYLRWTCEYAMSSSHQLNSFVGVSRVTFTKNGKVKSHIDYWDAAHNVYEKVPILGSILRFIKNRIRA